MPKVGATIHLKGHRYYIFQAAYERMGRPRKLYTEFHKDFLLVTPSAQGRAVTATSTGHFLSAPSYTQLPTEGYFDFYDQLIGETYRFKRVRSLNDLSGISRRS